MELSTNLRFASSADRTTEDKYDSKYPYERVADAQGNALPVARDYAQSYKDTAGAGYLLDWNYYPLDERKPNRKNAYTDYQLNLGLSYKINSFLKWSINYQYTRNVQQIYSERGVDRYSTRKVINEFSQLNHTTGTVYRPFPLGAILSTSDINTTGHFGRTQLSFHHNTGWHGISAELGYEMRSTEYWNNSKTLYGYNASTASDIPVNHLVDYPQFVTGSTRNIPINSFQDGTSNRYLSYFSTFGYDFKGRYIFNASARSDASNIFGVKSNQKKVPLWSVGAGWMIHKERFYNISWLPTLELRITNGYLGNVDKTVSAVTAASAPLVGSDGVPFVIIQNPPNPALRWEKMNTWNIGLEFSTRNKIIAGTIEWFHKNGVDQIGSSPIAPQTGLLTFRGNTANFVGQGIDIVLNTKNIEGAFSWNTNFFFNLAKDKVTKYLLRQTSPRIYVSNNQQSPMEGKPVNALFSYPWAGLDNEGMPQGWLDGKITKDYSAITSNKDFSQLIYHGSGRPTISGGFRNTISYGAWELSTSIIYKMGYYFRRPVLKNSYLFSTTGVVYKSPDYAKRWQKPGDELITDVPAAIYPVTTNWESFYDYSSVTVEKGDHIRLQNIRLQFNPRLKGSVAKLMRSLVVSGMANNLGILWRANNKGLDPDNPRSYPDPISYSLNLVATF
ncbi:MAG: TonB-dependent receptor domain-containing protein [Pseudobacter sp.]|uniref:TonB-dependent receptor domain-containing protein n=1 Tax=Pseudobacter sp. TaxID=2045420 RepID=UPI003F7E8980